MVHGNLLDFFWSMYALNCQLQYTHFLPSPFFAIAWKKKKKTFLDLVKKFIAYLSTCDETDTLHQGGRALHNRFFTQFPSLGDV